MTMYTISAFLLAIAIVESKCDDNAIGLQGEIGRYQILKCYVDDVNRTHHTTYRHKDMRNPAIAKHVVLAYMNYYGIRYMQDTGLEPTFEVLARIHNGGPFGYRLEHTKTYWLKVKNEMERMK